jgi:GTPase SAR1 family protein
MSRFAFIKHEVQGLNGELERLLGQAQALPGVAEQAFTGWGHTCRGIARQMAEETFRVAVVGPIKSGKSTFTNSFFRRDFLKRGAGVVTSIVTRIRRGECTRARLLFKSWDEINAEMDSALVLFPSRPWAPEHERFDIRRSRDRDALFAALETLGADELVTNGTRNANSVLLASYLKGFPLVREIIGSEAATAEFVGERFAEHKRFVGDDALSVFLKDVSLEIQAEEVDESIEIADCQGSDSPNPLHLAMIQDYLLHTHLVLYVISSRTGLRRADIRFLTMIRKMGIIENALFILNIDFGEHESCAELETLARRVREELSLIRPEPPLYTLSALANLLRAMQASGDIGERDAARLAQWQAEETLCQLSERETRRLEADLQRKLNHERIALMLGSHLDRLGVIHHGLQRWIDTARSMLSRDAQGAAAVRTRAGVQQQRVDQVRTVVHNTLQGTVQRVKEQLRQEVDRFFHPQSSTVVRGTLDFVRGYQPALERYETQLGAASFAHVLYFVFLDFKGALEAFMAEQVNPEIIRFVREAEHRIQQQLAAATETFDGLLGDSIAGSRDAAEAVGVCGVWPEGGALQLPDLDDVKRVAGAALPSAVASIRYSARVKTEAFFRFGCYSVLEFCRRVLKQAARNKRPGEALHALHDGITRIRRETEGTILFHFKNYQENVKYQYLFKMCDALAGSLLSAAGDRCRSYGDDLTRLIDLAGRSEGERQQAIVALGELERACARIGDRLQSAQAQLTRNMSVEA